MFRPTRRYNKNPARRKVPGVGAENRIGTRSFIVLVTADAGLASPDVLMTFDHAVFYTGILPGWTVVAGGQTVIAAEQQSPTTVLFTFSADVAAAALLSIPFEDPSIRDSAGGYVRTQNLTTT